MRGLMCFNRRGLTMLPLILSLIIISLMKIAAAETTAARTDSLINNLTARDKDYTVRAQAALALGWTGDKKAVRPLLEILEKEKPGTDQDPGSAIMEMRRFVIWALGKIGDPEAVPPLIETLDGSDASQEFGQTIGGPGEVSSTWALSIENFKKPEDLRDRSRIYCGVALALGNIGKPAVQPLLSVLKDKRANIRKGAVRALGYIGDKKAIGPLLKALFDKDPGIRCESVIALGMINDKKAVKPLIKMLRDSSGDVRCIAAKALGRIHDRRAIEPLKKVLKDSDPSVREAAAEAVKNIESKE